MSIDFQSETLLSFSQATKGLPGRPHLSTLHRWRLRGIRGVRLETCMVGGRRYTSREALQRFSDAITAAATGERAPCRTSRQRRRDIDAVERDLNEAGL